MTRPANPKGRPEAGITLVSLRAFVTVVEAGGFGPAAERLGVSQPAVSVQTAALEQALGLLLLNRRPRLELTEPGREMFNRARLVLGRVEEMDQAMQDLRQLDRGQFCLGYSTPHYAMPILARYRQNFSSVHVSMKTGNTTELLSLISDCRVDVAILALAEEPEDLHCMRFARPDLCLCVPVTSPLSSCIRIDPTQIAGLPLILREPGSVTRQVFERICAASNVPAAPSLIAASREAVVEAVRAGLGFGPVFSGTGQTGDDLAVIPFGDTPPTVGVYAVSLRETIDLPTVGAFFRLLEGDLSPDQQGPGPAL